MRDILLRNSKCGLRNIQSEAWKKRNSENIYGGFRNVDYEWGIQIAECGGFDVELFDFELKFCNPNSAIYIGINSGSFSGFNQAI
jgi:hypothetical protein